MPTGRAILEGNALPEEGIWLLLEGAFRQPKGPGEFRKDYPHSASQKICTTTDN